MAYQRGQRKKNVLRVYVLISRNRNACISHKFFSVAGEWETYTYSVCCCRAVGTSYYMPTLKKRKKMSFWKPSRVIARNRTDLVSRRPTTNEIIEIYYY